MTIHSVLQLMVSVFFLLCFTTLSRGHGRFLSMSASNIVSSAYKFKIVPTIFVNITNSQRSIFERKMKLIKISVSRITDNFFICKMYMKLKYEILNHRKQNLVSVYINVITLSRKRQLTITDWWCCKISDRYCYSFSTMTNEKVAK